MVVHFDLFHIVLSFTGNGTLLFANRRNKLPQCRNLVQPIVLLDFIQGAK